LSLVAPSQASYCWWGRSTAGRRACLGVAYTRPCCDPVLKSFLWLYLPESH
jgi:hypothetical protein